MFKITGKSVQRILSVILASVLILTTLIVFDFSSFPIPVAAATLTVLNGNDSGADSLRDVLSRANNGDTITFAPGVTTITLTSGELSVIDVYKSITIDGGINGITITKNATSPFRILFYKASSMQTLTLKNLTIENGNPNADTGNGNGGGVCVTNSSLVIENCTFKNNTAIYCSNPLAGEGGGAVFFNALSSCTISIKNCVFLGNTSTYGGAVSAAMLNLLENCTFENNTATKGGGAVFTMCDNSVVAVIKNCKFENNDGGQLGGAVYAQVTAFLTNCVMNNNKASNNGGAVWTGNSVIMANCTMAFNQGPSSYVYNSGSAVFSSANAYLFHCTIAGNTGGMGAVGTTGQLLLSNCLFTDNKNYSGILSHYAGSWNSACVSKFDNSTIDLPVRFDLDDPLTDDGYLVPWITADVIAANVLDGSEFGFYYLTATQKTDVLNALGGDILYNARAGTSCTYGALELVLAPIAVKYSVINGNGSLTATANDFPIASGGIANPGDKIVFTATPASGYKVKQWKLNGQTVNGKNLTYTIENIILPCVVTVEFETSDIVFNIKKNLDPFFNHGKTFTLRQGGTAEYTGTATQNMIDYSKVTFNTVADGTYNIFDGTFDTGAIITITNGVVSLDNDNGYFITLSDSDNSIAINYFSIEYEILYEVGGVQHSNCPASISAVYDGTSISSGEIVLGGKTLVVTATGEADESEGLYYAYSWFGYDCEVLGANFGHVIMGSDTQTTIVDIPMMRSCMVLVNPWWRQILYIKKDGAAWTDHGKTYILKTSGYDRTTTDTEDTLIFEKVPSTTYYIFDGETNTGLYFITGNVNGSYTLNYYTINYNNLNGAANDVNPVLYLSGIGVASFADPGERTGYVFMGWYDAETNGNQVTEISDAEAGIKTLWAYWAETYNIAYNNLNGASNSNPDAYIYGGGVDSFADPGERSGYTFDGWYDAETNGNQITAISDTDTGDKTLWAYWTANVYNITYNNLNGATNGNPATYSYGVGVDLFVNPGNRTGYVFDGWYDDETSGNQITSISDTDTGDKTLWARWESTGGGNTTTSTSDLSTTAAPTETETATTKETTTEETIDETTTTENINVTEPTGGNTTEDETTTESLTQPTEDTEEIPTTAKPAISVIVEPETTAEVPISTEPNIEESEEKEEFENRVPLGNGWWAEYNEQEAVWYIYDENGNPLGTIKLADGENINEIDIAERLVPLEPTIIDSRLNPQTGDNIIFVLTMIIVGTIICGINMTAFQKKKT